MKRPVWVSRAVAEHVSRHLWRYPDATPGEVFTIVRAHLPDVTRAEVDAAIAAQRTNNSNNEKEN